MCSLANTAVNQHFTVRPTHSLSSTVAFGALAAGVKVRTKIKMKIKGAGHVERGTQLSFPAVWSADDQTHISSVKARERLSSRELRAATPSVITKL